MYETFVKILKDVQNCNLILSIKEMSKYQNNKITATNQSKRKQLHNPIKIKRKQTWLRQARENAYDQVAVGIALESDWMSG